MRDQNDSRGLGVKQSPGDVRKGWLQISKNLTAHPIGFPPRAHAVFVDEDGFLVCRASRTISLRIPTRSPQEHQRGPSGFDMLFLYWVLNMRLMRRENRLTMTAVEMLDDMGLECARHNHRCLNRAVAYWQHMGLHLDRFYKPDGKRKNNGEWATLTLGPPISVMDDAIVVNDEWGPLIPGSYYKRFPRKLPVHALDQKLVLRTCGGRGEVITRLASRRQLTRLLGINHTSRNITLEIVLGSTRKWLKGLGCRMDCEFGKDGGVTFTTKLGDVMPKLTRTKVALARAKATKAKNKEAWHDGW